MPRERKRKMNEEKRQYDRLFYEIRTRICELEMYDGPPSFEATILRQVVCFMNRIHGGRLLTAKDVDESKERWNAALRYYSLSSSPPPPQLSADDRFLAELFQGVSSTKGYSRVVMEPLVHAHILEVYETMWPELRKLHHKTMPCFIDYVYYLCGALSEYKMDEERFYVESRRALLAAMKLGSWLDEIMIEMHSKRIQSQWGRAGVK